MKSIEMTRRERRSVLILCTLIVLVQSLPLFFEDRAENLPEELIAGLVRDSLNYNAHTASWLFPASVDTALPPFQFDPNRISEDSLHVLGFSKFYSNNLVKYRSSNGRFHRFEDMYRIYGADSVQLERMRTYAFFPARKPKFPASPTHPGTNTPDRPNANGSDGAQRPDQPLLIDINTVDSSVLVGLSGVGPVLAVRIIKYRDLLGGFYQVDQLEEVYGLSAEIIDRFRLRLKIGTAHHSINLTAATFRDVLRHPYTDYEMTKVLLNNKELKVDSLFSLLLEVSDDQSVKRLMPYLSKTPWKWKPSIDSTKT